MTDKSNNPPIDAPNEPPAANPPAPDQEAVIVEPIDEQQLEVGEDGTLQVMRSTASASMAPKDGKTGAPDGIGAGLEGGQGQEAAKSTTTKAKRGTAPKAKAK